MSAHTRQQQQSSDNYSAPSNDFANQSHGEFDLDQAVMLQQMARNSTAGEGDATLYSYDHGGNGMSGFEGHGKEQDGANGAAGTFPDPAQLLENYNKESVREERSIGSTSVNSGNGEGMEYSSYAHPPAAPNELDDMDPAALLKSLANFEPTPVNNRVNNSNTSEQDGQHHGPHAPQFSNDHFASLLQAAATAGQSQENDHTRHNSRRNSRGQSVDEWRGIPGSRGNAFAQQPPPQSHSQKRKRSPDGAPQDETASAPGFIKPQARRKKAKEVDLDQLARERAIWPASDSEEESDPDLHAYGGPSLTASDARAAGVHSAAALFRRPTPASKKYTRPPMSKLFTSLELNPEQFLFLQAAAKSYMLDPAHPERVHCVGNKGRADTDMVKLKLFGCVDAFLEDEGWGERCWGVGAERDFREMRRLKWPEGKNKIITLVTPLMRRMVTNERQRLYATETRRVTGGKKGQPASGTPPQASPHHAAPQQHPEIDPKLGDYHYNLDPAFRSSSAAATSADRPAAGSTPPACTTHYKISILAPAPAPSQLLHTSALTSISCPVFSSLMQHIRSVLAKPLSAPAADGAAEGEAGLYKLCGVRALTPAGLVCVGAAEQWEEAVKAVDEAVWMERVVRVVVDVGKAGEGRGGSVGAK